MRFVNEKFETIHRDSIDLSKGYLVRAMAVKENATPIDNVEKFAWFDDDYEEVEMFILNKEPDSTPSEFDKIQAQVAYTAMMTNTLLEESR